MRFALVGTGHMAQEHIRTLALVPGHDVVALVDPVAASLEWARRSLAGTGYPAPHAVPGFADVPSMLDAVRADAVIVASPNHTHHRVLEPLLATDLHILCEKPLCTTMADAQDIVRRSQGRKGIVWVGMEYRFMPPIARFIEDIHAGRTGVLRRVALHEHRFPFLDKVGDWNRFNRNTGGTMVEKCCHFFDLMRTIVRAEPVRVFCSGAADVNHLDERYGGERPDILDNSYTIVDFDNGVRAMLDLCMFADGSEEQEQLVAIGDRAKLEVGIPSGVVTWSPRVPPHAPKPVTRERIAVREDVLAAGHHHGATYFQLLAFLEAAAGHRPVQVTPHDGLVAVAMGTAAEISAREKRVVQISELVTLEPRAAGAAS
ncbi:Gfo/Idh/MocA family protein [Gluconacetobacter johannae]|uniref:Gfo/Idh/MocA family oxidoreductase n=2 Tax=Gluconacetobacter johannae TaxID=112140 RepID=A0A7W4P5J3_9PROT|nr:Gfo/Idh/MocA family oxidoreductase [Gluconacetobacter johannae]MBB2176203.1 Gfo/Idh/MocA family oxidoreductase [Gluconacetobacter johannae]